MKKEKISLMFIGIMIILIIPIVSPLVLSHGASSTKPVHQYVTNESKFIWKLIPYEIKQKLKNPINEQLDELGKADYDKEDDIITGSGEEDYRKSTKKELWRNHYWNPDRPMFNSSYDYGLYGSSSGSFVRAKNIWEEDVIKNYLMGNIDEAYYHFGWVVHLLQDTTVPAHVHDDCHISPDVIIAGVQIGEYVCYSDEYEYFIADVNNSFTNTQGKGNFNHWQGSDYENQYYKYENLTDLTDSEWLDINSRLNQAGYPSELFKLFWYTAQKTQYYASDDKYGNTTFRKSGSADTYNFSNTYSNLWQGENVNFVMDKDDIEADASACNSVGVCPNLANISEALMPHAMKATAGLYRLFSDVMDSLEWETFHNNNRRTGYTIMKGDLWRFN